ncbi:unnamed protein product [Vicia faba]|uniref:Uncharacterized protein n=1 Tax=Vicia faba TaxID=3906 RepID=A0AAV0ZJ65_VICFA|nr:unnamed protein product [Vicia faba]
MNQVKNGLRVVNNFSRIRRCFPKSKILKDTPQEKNNIGRRPKERKYFLCCWPFKKENKKNKGIEALIREETLDSLMLEKKSPQTKELNSPMPKIPPCIGIVHDEPWSASIEKILEINLIDKVLESTRYPLHEVRQEHTHSSPAPRSSTPFLRS